MSDTPGSNPQTPPATTVTPTGPSMEEIKAQMQAEFDRQREGLIRDVQEERRKRQEMEAKLNQPAPASSAASHDVTQDELGKVLNPYIEPVRKEAQAARAMLAKYEEDKALEVMASRLGKSKADILGDSKIQERFIATRNKWGVTGASLSDVTIKTLDLMDLEDMRQKEAERVRAAAAVSTGGSLPPGTPPAPVAGKQKFTAEEFEKMDMLKYDKLNSAGSFVQDPQTGEITFTPS